MWINLSPLFMFRRIFQFTTLRQYNRMNFMDPKSVYNLANIRDDLIRMEDTIIFDLIERSDFYTMPSVYEKNSPNIKIPNFDGSFLDWIFQQHEIVESQVRRYDSPDQYPFYPHVIKKSFLPPLHYPKILANYSNEININSYLMDVYIKEIVPKIAKKGGDESENFGSTSIIDIHTLQDISRRIHFGLFVAESKFQADRQLYTELIKNRDVEGIMKNITNAVVEEKILERLLIKAKAYGTDPTAGVEGKSKIEPEIVVKIYKDYVIPLTKKVEVEYLLRRLEDPDF